MACSNLAGTTRRVCQVRERGSLNDFIAQPPATLTAEERYNRIAEAAYLRAAARGFAGGDPLQDWLEAEANLMRFVEQGLETERS